MLNTVKLPLYLSWRQLKNVIGWAYSRAHTWRMMFDPEYAHDPFPQCGKLSAHRSGRVVSQLLGRFIISSTLNAAYRRSLIPRSQWNPAYLSRATGFRPSL